MLVVTIPLSIIKTYTYLSYVSMVGIFCATLGGMILIGFCSNQLVTNQAPSGEVKVFDISQFFGYVGIAMFAFEGNGIVINLKAATLNKQRYPSLLRFAMVTIIVWYMILATVSYATYKDQTG
jgi:amino acid permease